MTQIPKSTPYRLPNLRKPAFIVFMASLVVSALTGIIVFLLGDFEDFDETQFRVLFSALTVGGFSITSLGSSALQGRGPYRFVTYAGISVSALGFVLFLIGIWGDVDIEGFWKSAASVAVVAISIAHMALLLLVAPRHPLVRYTLHTTIAVICALAILLIVIITLLPEEGSFFRLLGVLAILDVLGTVSVPLLRKATARQ